MNLQRIPQRLVLPAASAPLNFSSAFAITLPFRPLQRHRTLFGFGKRKNTQDDNQSKPGDALVEQYLRNKADPPPITMPNHGDLAPGSIFEKSDIFEGRPEKPTGKKRNVRAMAMSLDPDPDGRKRWERRMVIREIRRRGRMTKAEMLKQTERQSVSKSPFIKTSVKKLGALARQIAGKSVDHALVQMRFSKKKAAQSVKKELELAIQKAKQIRGMGKGAPEGTEKQKVEIRLKDGTKHVVKDKTDIYIDQAWVGRGTYQPEREYRARGRSNILNKPFTSISFLLKEEATRIREAQERQQKVDNRKPWLQLPDRNVSAQHQYPLW